MELNVGDYVRTKSYGIRKINGFSSTLEEDFIDCNYNETTNVLINKKEVINSSPNIIDLIDYDDILKIIYEDKEYICKVINVSGVKGVQLTSTLSVGLGIVEADIKSVLTHEQFETMKYVVGEE